MHRQRNGFTLFEMMIVLVIVGLAMTVAPSIMAGLQGSRLRAASDELVWRLRETRNEAIRRGTTTELVLDMSKRTYAITTEKGVFQIPAVVDAVDVKPDALRQTGGIVRIRFLADGTATAARITLRHGTSSGEIAVDWLTGGVRIDG
jgi:general secretion pathway protein H